MPLIQCNQGKDFTQAINDIDSDSTHSSDGTDSLSNSDLDNGDLMQICDAIAAPPANVSTQDLHKALENAQKLLLDMRGEHRESLKKIALLEATVRKDGIKAELFQFIPSTDHNMMAHKNFGSHFVKGINNVCAEMLSDVKSCVAAIFGLDAKFFICSYAWDTEPSCKSLLLNPQVQYTKFVPILFPHLDHLLRDQFLKTAKLVYILKVSLFGRSSLAANAVPTPKTKAKIWELCAVTPGLIAAAAIVAIFVLSGDKELVEVGDKGAWADGVFTFFNNSLFSTSSAATLLNSDSMLLGDLTSGPCDSWEEMFEHAMETGAELPELNMIQTLLVGPVIEASSSAPVPQSISAAMQGLALAEHLPPAVVNEDIEAEPVVLEAPVAAQKPKPRQKGKAVAADSNISEDQASANVEPEVSSLVVSGSGVRRGRSKTTK
ncbi:uncharacterized protein EDB93DRAFT_1245736 [Suillus bovinus]|uniref:uncharacterized protein n=1 Tax=Suillus bovinus TaxID=48563 RepID=UPI001B871F82|nr:uncharacterized protein EDB93DRAFT_1245736 [Suillus bovinus]KAG2159183.1 hypothetical protein EDB93DRAFT_1245736 [Suillus bovinus]